MLKSCGLVERTFFFQSLFSPPRTIPTTTFLNICLWSDTCIAIDLLFLPFVSSFSPRLSPFRFRNLLMISRGGLLLLLLRVKQDQIHLPIATRKTNIFSQRSKFLA